MNLEKELAKAKHMFRSDLDTKEKQDAFIKGFRVGFRKGNQTQVKKLLEMEE